MVKNMGITKSQLPKTESVGEATLAVHLRCHGFDYEREVRFDPKRRWRIDFVVEKTLAIEVEGGIWSGGRHTRGSGYTADLEKHNAITLAGYRLLRFSTEMVRSGEAINTILASLLALALAETPVRAPDEANDHPDAHKGKQRAHNGKNHVADIHIDPPKQPSKLAR